MRACFVSRCGNAAEFGRAAALWSRASIAGAAAGSAPTPSLRAAFGALRRFRARCGAAEISRLFLTAARRLYNCGAKIYFCEVQR